MGISGLQFGLEIGNKIVGNKIVDKNIVDKNIVDKSMICQMLRFLYKEGK